MFCRDFDFGFGDSRNGFWALWPRNQNSIRGFGSDFRAGVESEVTVPTWSYNGAGRAVLGALASKKGGVASGAARRFKLSLLIVFSPLLTLYTILCGFSFRVEKMFGCSISLSWLVLALARKHRHKPLCPDSSKPSTPSKPSFSPSKRFDVSSPVILPFETFEAFFVLTLEAFADLRVVKTPGNHKMT